MFFAQNYFLLDCDPTETSFASKIGFSYNRRSKLYYTPFAEVAAKVAQFGDAHSRKMIEERRRWEKKVIAESSAQWSKFNPPAPKGLSYLPYQRAGIASAVSKRDTLLADDMGLGKTIQAIGFCNVVKPDPILVISPVSAKINWGRELDKWLTYNPKKLIINYDVLGKWSDQIKGKNWGALIGDEIHYAKNPQARRTLEIVGGRRRYNKLWEKYSPIVADRKILLTGTPILNKPIELFSILKYIYPEGFSNQMQYAKQYCNAFRDDFGRWDFTGASNLEELQQRLRASVMVRRLKEDVLTDLPPKVRQIIEIDPDTRTLKALKKEAVQWKERAGVKDVTKLNDEEYANVVRMMKSATKSVKLDEWSTARKETALAKLPLIVDHLKNAVNSTGKVIIFCWHKEVVEELKNIFPNCVAVVGGMTDKAKQTAVDTFQNDKDCHVFVGNIKAAGVALTLTAAKLVIFIEEDPVPGNITQAEDRAHRIGQHYSLLVQHLVLRGSLDSTTAKIVIRKQGITRSALDIEVDPELRRMLA